MDRWLSQSDAETHCICSRPSAPEDSRRSITRITSECIWMSLKKWGLEAAEFFAESIVHIVQQTAQTLSGAVHQTSSCAPAPSHSAVKPSPSSFVRRTAWLLPVVACPTRTGSPGFSARMSTPNRSCRILAYWFQCSTTLAVLDRTEAMPSLLATSQPRVSRWGA